MAQSLTQSRSGNQAVLDPYAILITQAVDLIQTFDEIISTVDTHSESYFDSKKIEDKTTRVFLKQVFFGVKRYFKFAKVFTDALFRVNSASTNRSSQTLYHIFLYLLLFRYEDLPKDELSGFLKSQDAVKMNVFLEFLFDTDTLRKEVYEDWVMIYEDNYVEELIEGLEKKRDELGKVLSTIIEKAVGKGSAGDTKLSTKLGSFKKEEVKKFEATKPQPFQLSQSKPRAIPEPIAIPKVVKANPVPKSLYSTTLKNVEEEKAKRKEQIYKETKEQMAKLAKPFELATHTRPMHLDELKKEREEHWRKMTKIAEKQAREVPEYPQVEVKLNEAAIRKEALAIKAKEKEEADRERELELNNRDGAEFEVWKERHKRLDREEELRKQMERKIEMELAQEAAKKAIEHKEDERKRQVEKVKKEKEKDQVKREKNKKKDLERKLELKSDIVETRGKVEKVKEKIYKEKVEAVEEMKEKQKIEAELKKLEEKKQQEFRDQLIMKIRELDRKVIKKTKDFDPAQPISHGLLEEMTLVELEEKHKQVKEEFKRQEEEKRAQIHQAKQQHRQEVDQMMAMISGARNERAAKNQANRVAKKVKLEKRSERINKETETQAVEVYHKILDKKEKLRIEDEEVRRLEKEIRLKKQYMKADQDKVEELAWKNLEDGAEREAKDRQNRKLLEQEKVESTKLKEREMMAENMRREFESTLDRQKTYNSRKQQEEADKEILNRMNRASQQEMVNSIKDFKQAHHENILESRPYDTKITNLSRTGRILGNSG